MPANAAGVKSKQRDIPATSAPRERRTNNLSERRARENRRLRRQRYAHRIWPLGERVLFELVDHIADRFDLEDEVDRLLDRFAALDPALLRALGGEKLPQPPIHTVARR